MAALSPRPGGWAVSVGDNSQKAVTPAGPGIPGGIFQGLKSRCLSSQETQGAYLPVSQHPTHAGPCAQRPWPPPQSGGGSVTGAIALRSRL